MHVPTQKRMFRRCAFFDPGQLPLQHPVSSKVLSIKVEKVRTVKPNSLKPEPKVLLLVNQLKLQPNVSSNSELNPTTSGTEPAQLRSS